MQGHGACGNVLPGDDVGIGGVVVDFIHEAARGKFGHAQARGIAVRGFGEVAHENPQHARGFIAHCAAVVALAPDDVGVHARAGNVFAHFVDDEQVDVVKGQGRAPHLGLGLQHFFPRFKVRCRDGFDERGFVIAVFEGCHAKGNGHFPAYDSTDQAHDFVKGVVDDGAVVHGRAFVLA